MASWESILKRWAGLRTAHQAVLLEDASKVLAQDRAMTKAHNQKALGTADDAGDDMIHVGDSVQHVYPQPPKSGIPGWAATLLGAAAGVGIASGGLLLRDRLSAPEPTELEIKYWIEDGRLKTEVVDPKKGAKP